MIRRLTGKILSKTDQTLVIDVNNVGYLVYSPQCAEINLNDTAVFHTHLAVKENALDIYGFLIEDELIMFEHLLKLQKIGPKSALQIMAQADLELIKTAVVSDDPARLSKMSGMGKKTAEKVVAGLIEIYDKQGLLADMSTNAPGSESAHLSDTIDALIALGYPEHDSRKTVQQIVETNPELKSTNDILKKALGNLGKN